ncbi:MAG: hypothetical protein N2D54_03065 [Chloroflexota bacterium]
MNIRLKKWVTILVGCIFLLSACGTTSGYSGVTPSENNLYRVAPEFIDIYQHFEGLGTGAHPFGAPITTLFIENGLKKQYFLNIQLVYDSSASAESRISLAPLGSELNYSGPRGNLPGGDGDLQVEGYIIPSFFVPIYEELGAQITGAPLTEAIVNLEEDRVEQHFKNLGIYININDQAPSVYLLHYGLAVCGSSCQKQFSMVEGAVFAPQESGEPFISTASRIGVDFVGEQLVSPYTNDDGNEEVIFENMVLFSSGYRAFSRPTTLLIGYTPETPKQNTGVPGTKFIKTNGQLGYYVLNPLFEYLASHGGLDISGLPITNLFEYKTGIFRQCFENLCLDYYIDQPEVFQIQTAPLGRDYKQRFYDNMASESENSYSAQTVSFYIWEDASLLPSSQNQVLYASVKLNDIPASGIELTATITIPNEAPSTYRMSDTNNDGLSSVIVPRLDGMNGTLINYEICLNHSALGTSCQLDNFFIWFNSP